MNYPVTDKRSNILYWPTVYQKDIYQLQGLFCPKEMWDDNAVLKYLFVCSSLYFFIGFLNVKMTEDHCGIFEGTVPNFAWRARSNEKKLTAVKAGYFLAGSSGRQFSPTCWRPVRGNRRTRRRINKSKAVPLQAWTGPEGSRKLRLPGFMTVGTWV